MKNKFRIIISTFLLVGLGISTQAHAQDIEDFTISCEDVEGVTVWLNTDPISNTPVVTSQIRFAPEAGDNFVQHCTYASGRPFHIMAGTQIIHTNTRHFSPLPPKIVFSDKKWKDARLKFMAICPKKINELPDQVNEKNNFYKFWIADPEKRKAFKEYLPKNQHP